MIRTAADVIAVAKARGFGIAVDPGPPPMPVLVVGTAPRSLATEALMEALRAWRLEIIEIIASERSSSSCSARTLGCDFVAELPETPIQ